LAEAVSRTDDAHHEDTKRTKGHEKRFVVLRDLRGFV